MQSKSGIAIKVLLLVLACAPFGLAQQAPGPPAAAPIPSQIFSAKKVFLSNAVGDTDISPDHISGGPERAYNQLYAGMKAWGRYDLVSTPADAELIFETDFTAPLSFAHAIDHPVPRAQLRLIIRDRQSRAVLWTFLEYLDRQKVSGKWTHDKAFDQTILTLIADVQKLATPAGASTS
ncbi:MAG: hypothetical protein ACXVK3_13845 [Candidatus Angelobacter sp.]